jgi:hypothetical protein
MSPRKLPETTIPPRVTRAQILALFAIGVVCVADDADQGFRLLAGPALSLIVVREDGRRWKIEADGERITESLGEVSRGT